MGSQKCSQQQCQFLVNLALERVHEDETVTGKSKRYFPDIHWNRKSVVSGLNH
jgi:hypothetical protein